MSDVLYLQNIKAKDLFIIKWRMTHRCNFHCPYCIGQKDNSNRLLPFAEEQELLRQTASQINDLINRLPSEFKRVKIELIGGEVSLFDLQGILSYITSPRLWRIQMTSNFSESVAYYSELGDFLQNKNVEFSLTASFHNFTQNPLDKFLQKAKEIKPHCTLFIVEIVSTIDNQDLVRDFEKQAKAAEIDYKIDMDMRPEQAENRINNKFYCSESRKKESYRFKALVEDADGDIFIKEYKTRNAFFEDTSINQLQEKKYFDTKGYICSLGYNYIYIHVNEVACRNEGDPNCSQRTPVSKFNPLTKPVRCLGIRCTLCGSMNLYRSEKYIGEEL